MKPVGDGEQRRGVRWWIKTVRATQPWWSTSTVRSFWQHMLVGKRLFDLFDYDAPTKGGAAHRWTPNSCAIANRREADRLADWQPAAGSAAGRSGLNRPPSPDVIATLDREGPAAGHHVHLLPAGCDGADQGSAFAARCGSPPPRTGPYRRVIDRRCGDLADADLAVLDYYEWRRGCCAWPPTTPGCCPRSATVENCSPRD